ncbi:MAG: undecaprenyl-diphosphate phosphatase [Coprococcus sp.]
MSLLQSILMGIIQGLTEFLPVSSSGHLALFKNIFNINTETGLLFDTMLHLGTLVAVCIVYWKDVKNLFTAAFQLLFDIVISALISAAKGSASIAASSAPRSLLCDPTNHSDRYMVLLP